MDYYFINHTKLHIVKTGNDAKNNIGNCLFESIRNNKWSIGDKIEFVDSLHYTNEKLRTLVNYKKYLCTISDYTYFNY
jgi:hypothetical protein